MVFRNITNNDISILAHIYVETYNCPPWNDEWTIELATQKLDELINCCDSYGLVCVDDNKIIGAIVGNSEIYYNCQQFFIKDFFVMPSYQGKGIGGTLMNELEKKLKYKGIQKTYLFTSRTDKTEIFYQKRGYKSWNDMVMMGKDLNE